MSIINSIHPSAILGEGTRVWNFSVILANVTIGKNCNIGSCCEIGHGTKIGDGTRIGFNSFFPPNSRIGNGVFIGPGVVCCDDRDPKVNNSDYKAEPPVIEDGASVGAGAVLLPGVKIGAGARIGAGAIVTKDVVSMSMVRGEPARVREPIRT